MATDTILPVNLQEQINTQKTLIETLTKRVDSLEDKHTENIPVKGEVLYTTLDVEGKEVEVLSFPGGENCLGRVLDRELAAQVG